MTSSRSLATAFAVFVLVFVGTHVLSFPGSLSHLMAVTHDQPILDLKASFSSAETYQRLDAFGEAGREAYLMTMLTVDTIFPLSAFLFLFLLARYAATRIELRDRRAGMLSSLSVAYLLLDFLENITVAALLLNFPERMEFLAANIGFLTIAKRIAMSAALVVPIALISAIAGRPRAPSSRRPAAPLQ